MSAFSWGSSWGPAWGLNFGGGEVVPIEPSQIWVPHVGGGGRSARHIDSEDTRNFIAHQNNLAVALTLDAIACGLFDEP